MVLLIIYRMFVLIVHQRQYFMCSVMMPDLGLYPRTVLAPAEYHFVVSGRASTNKW